jgi:two-component system, LuxR family, response regulator FixJ
MSEGKRKSAPKASARPGGVSMAFIEKTVGMSVAEARERHGRLTDRQRQVAELMARGLVNRRIADELGISPKTLDIHRADVFERLEAKTAATVAAVVLMVGLAGS